MKRLLALGLTLLMGLSLLTGCGSKKTELRKSGLYYDASGISPNAVLMTVDGWDMTAERYFYWLTTDCDYISHSFQPDGALDWETERSGQTLGEYVQAEAVRSTAFYATIERLAKKYGCAITSEDLGAIDTQWDTAVQQYGGEDAYLNVLAQVGVDKAMAQLVTADYYLYNHLYETFLDEKSDLYADDETISAYAEEHKLCAVDDVFVSTLEIDSNDATALAERRARAEMILDKLEHSDDPLAYFATLAGTYSDDPGRKDYPNGFTLEPNTGVMSAEFEQAALQLKENEWSGVVETPEGFYIILRTSLDLDTVKANYFDAMLHTTAENAKIEYAPEYETIDVGNFYKNLTESREKLPKVTNFGDPTLMPPEE